MRTLRSFMPAVPFLSSPYAIAAAVGSLMMRSTCTQAGAGLCPALSDDTQVHVQE